MGVLNRARAAWNVLWRQRMAFMRALLEDQPLHPPPIVEVEGDPIADISEKGIAMRVQPPSPSPPVSEEPLRGSREWRAKQARKRR